MRYQIKDWNKHFENHKSREHDICNWVAMPNKQDGLGPRRLLSAPNGVAFFGVWCLTLQRCSKQRKPRLGWLTENGKSDGVPWSFYDLKLLWGIDTPLIFETFQLLTDEKIGWMQVHDAIEDKGALRPPSDRPPGVYEGKKERRKEGTEEPDPFQGPEEFSQAMVLDWRKHRPADLPKALHDTWNRIASEHGGSVANAALQASRRIYGATYNHGQLSAAYQAAHRAGTLSQPAAQWPDPGAKLERPQSDGLPTMSASDHDKLMAELAAEGGSWADSEDE